MEYYVNYGRWCDGVIGPFDDPRVADAYAAQSTMRSQPTVCVARTPDPVKLVIAKAACRRCWHVVCADGEGRAVTVLVVAPDSAAASEAAMRALGGTWFPTSARAA